MASKKKKAKSESAPWNRGRTDAKQAAANRVAAKGYRGATKIGAGQRIAVENKRAGRQPNFKAQTQAVWNASKNAPSFVRAGSRKEASAKQLRATSRVSDASRMTNATARMGREIMRQNQAYTTTKGTLRTKGGQRRVERAQAGRVNDFRAKLAGWNKAFAKASAAGDALSARKAAAGARALKAEYKAWRKGGSRVNASG